MAIAKSLTLLSVLIPVLLCFISSATANIVVTGPRLPTSCVGYPCRGTVSTLPVWGVPSYQGIRPYYAPRWVSPYYSQFQGNQLLGQLQSNQFYNQHEANQLFHQLQSNQAFNQHEVNQLFGQLQNNQALNQHELSQLIMNAQMAGGYLRYPIAGAPYLYPAARSLVVA